MLVQHDDYEKKSANMNDKQGCKVKIKKSIPEKNLNNIGKL